MVKPLAIGSSSSKQVCQQEDGSSSRAQDGSNRGRLQWAVGSSNLLLLLLVQSSPRTPYLDQLEVMAGWGRDRGALNQLQALILEMALPHMFKIQMGGGDHEGSWRSTDATVDATKHATNYANR